MACSLAGGVALVVLCIAVALNTAALVLPLWSATSFSTSDAQSAVRAADLTAGVWGFCIDGSVRSSQLARSFDQCFYFHVPSSVALPALFAGNSSVYDDVSVCSGLAAASSNTTAQEDYVSTLAALAAQNETTFAAFLERSCGALGYSSLVLELASPVLGLLGLLALLASVVCFPPGEKRLLSTSGKAVVLLAALCAALALVLWIPQASALQDSHFGGGLVLAALALALYLNALALVSRHEKGSARGVGGQLPA